MCAYSEDGDNGTACHCVHVYAPVCVCVCVQAMFGSCMVLLRDHIPRAFTNAADVVALASHALAPVGMCVMGDGINAVLGGVLRGCGRQAWGAALTLIGYW